MKLLKKSEVPEAVANTLFDCYQGKVRYLGRMDGQEVYMSNPIPDAFLPAIFCLYDPVTGKVSQPDRDMELTIRHNFLS